MSEKIEKWIQKAQAKGLNVKVERDQGRCHEAISVQIRIEKIEAKDMLAVIYNSQMVSIHAFKGINGRWKHYARFYEAFSDERKLKQDQIVHQISVMAENRVNYLIER